MKRLALIALVAATPAIAQTPGSQLPSSETCTALKERVQLALAQADRGLQSDDAAAVAQWSSIAADYAEVFAAFCDDTEAE